MTILLTGASGFLGSHLARTLLARGDRVLAYRRENTDPWRLREAASQIRWFDLSASELAAPFTAGDRIDAVLHAATCYGRKGESLADLVETNVCFPLALHQAANTAGVARFLNIHTSLPPTVSAYARSKHQLVEWLRVAGGRVQAVHLAMEHFYGPDDDASKFVEWILRQLLSGAERIPLTRGEQLRDFLYIDDAVSACLRCLDQTDLADHEIIPVGSGESVSIRELAEACKVATQSSSQLDFGAMPYRETELMVSVAEIARLRALGWEPRVSLADGLQRAAEHLARRPAPDAPAGDA